MMYPFWELDLSKEEMEDDPRAVLEEKILFKDLKDKYMKWKNKHPESAKNYKDQYDWVENYHGYYPNKNKTAFGYYHNPNDKWDWYQIGGRWAGKLKLKTEAIGIRGQKSWTWQGENPYEDRKVDCAQIKDIDEEFLKKFTTFAVLRMEDGEPKWHEKLELGWFGGSHYDKYCCIAEELDVHEILKEFKYDYFWIEKKRWKGYSNEYVDLFIKTLHKHYRREGRKYILKDNLGNGKTEITEDLKYCDFFRNKHWSKNYYKRFLEGLEPNTYLAVVDYHI